MSSTKCRLILCAAIVAAVAFLAFLPALEYEFVWDDDALILFNNRISNPEAVASHFTKSFWNVSEDIQDISRPFYRPFIMTSFSLDYSMWHFKAAGYHFSNIIFHIINCLLVLMLARRTLRSDAFSLVAALLFAVHPVHVENVCWISGRTDLLCAIFLLSATFVYSLLLEDELPARLALPIVILLYIGSLLSKETGVIFPAIALAMALTSRKSLRDLSVISSLASLFIIACLYMILRTLMLSSAWNLDVNLTAAERIAAALLAIAHYTGLFLMLAKPDPHHIDAVPWSAFDPAAIVAGLSLLAYGAAMLLSYRNGRRSLAFWMAWPLIALLPVMNIGSFGDVVYADRFMYIPSVGACILASAALLKLSQKSTLRVPAMLACALALALSIRGLTSYMPVWTSNITLFEQAVSTSPSSAYIFYNLGNSYARDGRHAEACRSYARAITIQENYADALLNMAASLHALGRHKDAIILLTDTLKKGDKAYKINEVLADQYTREGMHELAAASRRKAVAMKKMNDLHNRTVYALLADCYRSLSDISSAINFYSRSIQYAPSYAAHNNLGECYLVLDSIDLALTHFRAASQIKATAEAYNNIGFILLREGEIDGAAIALKKASSLVDDATPHLTRAALAYNQARVAILRGENEEARLLLRKASKAARGWNLAPAILHDIDSMLSSLRD